jgi:hypothetical protein
VRATIFLLLACVACGAGSSRTDAGPGDDASFDANDGDAGPDAGSDGGSDAGPRCGADLLPQSMPSSGFLVHFAAEGQFGSIWVNSTSGIAHLAQWLTDTTQGIGAPGGPIELNATFNPGYSYRLLPTAVVFADTWAEVCDSTPCHVEETVDAWMTNPSIWCPIGFTPVRIWDCRQSASTGTCPTVYP